MINLAILIVILGIILVIIEIEEEGTMYSLVAFTLSFTLGIILFHVEESNCQAKYDVYDCYYDEETFSFKPTREIMEDN